MAWDKGFNFRDTAAYVTDGTNETYALEFAKESYPTTRNGVTFGWEQATFDDVNRDSTVDRRLAGIVYVHNDGAATQANFRVDLPATGDYTITLALGDTGFAQNAQYWQLKDTTTALATINDTNGTAADNYDDATGVNRTEANWPSQNATITETFTTTILRSLIGTPSAAGNSTTIAHLFVSQAAGAAEVLPGHGPLLAGLRNRLIQHV